MNQVAKEFEQKFVTLGEVQALSFETRELFYQILYYAQQLENALDFHRKTGSRSTEMTENYIPAED